MHENLIATDTPLKQPLSTPRFHRNRVENLELATLIYPCEDIRSDLLQELPFQSVACDAPEKQQLRSFIASERLIGRRTDEWNYMLLKVAETQIELRVDRVNAGREKKLAEAKLAELRPQLPLVSFRSIDVCRPDIMALPRPALHQAFSDALNAMAYELAKNMSRSLLLSRYGRLRRDARKDGLADYDFYRFLVHQQLAATTLKPDKQYEKLGKYTEDQLNRTYTQEVEIWTTQIIDRTIEATHRIAKHTHWTYNTRLFHPQDHRVDKPWWAQRLINLLQPLPWFKYLQVVAGDMYRERIVEHDERVETSIEQVPGEDALLRTEERKGVLISPALVLGEFTLIGWSDRLE